MKLSEVYFYPLQSLALSDTTKRFRLETLGEWSDGLGLSSLSMFKVVVLHRVDGPKVKLNIQGVLSMVCNCSCLDAY